MTVKDRLTKFAKYKERSVRAFEKACGLTVGYINAIRISIQPDKIQRIASQYPDLNTGWLLTGEGEMLKKNTSYQPTSTASDENILMSRDVFNLIVSQQNTIKEQQSTIAEQYKGHQDQQKNFESMQQSINSMLALQQNMITTLMTFQNRSAPEEENAECADAV